MPIVRYYSADALSEWKSEVILKALQKIDETVIKVSTEKCHHIELSEGQSLGQRGKKIVEWLLQSTRAEKGNTLKSETNLISDGIHSEIIEIGPRFNFSTAYSTNSVSICHNVGLDEVRRIEVSVRYLIEFDRAETKTKSPIIDAMVEHLGDRMTQCRYTSENTPVSSFDERLPKQESSWYYIPVLEEGRLAIENVNQSLGLAFDDWDLNFYTNLFKNHLKRNPTSVELFDCAQSNSEHSRHWFFKGLLQVDGVDVPESLMQLIGATQAFSNQNNTIKFSDNSSAIKGFEHDTLRPNDVEGPAVMSLKRVKSDLIFTAETHNMPTAVAPFSGATTGTGGRIRDVQGVGRGGLTIAGTAGYCVGALNIPGYKLDYEIQDAKYPSSFATPLQIIVEASNGASDYGNKFGEPVVAGFALSYGIQAANGGDRDEYVKPIMFSAGLGTMDASQTEKLAPQKGMLLVKIGGPVYRIGVGGGAASSVEVQGDHSKSALDFNAVQRGDAEMENKLNRVVRACIELGCDNPIVAIHDQGAGGNGNVLKELVEPGRAGAIIFTNEFLLGDPTITALELWGAEYQENNAILCRPESRRILEAICERERCPISIVGVVTGDGNVTLVEDSIVNLNKYVGKKLDSVPFQMHLDDILGDMPRKKFPLKRTPKQLVPLEFPDFKGDFTVPLKRVLSVMAVASKRFLTNKVDRCVTGLVAQQQCVGPMHTPLADFAITAVSHFTHAGIATSIGMQPIKGLVDAGAGARMSVAEAVSNLVCAGISSLRDVKCSGNWMWAAKLEGEGARLYDACKAMCAIMNELGIAVDGGKDSLSMAARVDQSQRVTSPGTLVISTYAPCPDVRVKVTPELKGPQHQISTQLVWVNISRRFRLGGSALAQAYSQLGQNSPDIENPANLRNAFEVTQSLLKKGLILAGHDISDGGLIVCLIELALAGNVGLCIDLRLAQADLGINATETATATAILFAEECGWVLEIPTNKSTEVLAAFKEVKVTAFIIGAPQMKPEVVIQLNDAKIVSPLCDLVRAWERTSFEIEKLQANVKCVEEEMELLASGFRPPFKCTFNPDAEIAFAKMSTRKICVAVVREEGTNGDREMIASLIRSSFEVHDITMDDLLVGKARLDARYRGVIFPGGFSYADTLGSAKGWAASILFNDHIRQQFDAFKDRSDTFSLGVCNGCQLMSLIGWIGDKTAANKGTPEIVLTHNKSERFECRWSSVKINNSKSIMLRGMAGSMLGCWVAHGEGQFAFQSNQMQAAIAKGQCIALQYVDENGGPTMVYPLNPNGSIDGIAGICSEDGRHLAMMPHPERCTQMWQWPYIPPGCTYQKSPWQSMFDSAYIWCAENIPA